MTPQEEKFLTELKELCERHGLVAVPSFELRPSAHDPMLIVPLDDDWRKYLGDRVYGTQDE